MNATLLSTNASDVYEMFTDDVIPFIVGVFILGCVLIFLLVSLFCLCWIKRKQKRLNPEYSQVETDSDSESINLKELSEKMLEKRKIKTKRRVKYLNEEALFLEDGCRKAYQQRDLLLGINNYFVTDQAACTVPMIEKEYIPATVAIPIQPMKVCWLGYAAP